MATLRVAASRASPLDAEIRLAPADGLLRSKEGEIKACEHNVRALMAAAPRYADLHFDDFLSCLRLDGRDWKDADDLEALGWLQSEHGVPRFTLNQVRNGARMLGYSRRRDSLQEFVDGLPAWDGIPRIEFALTEAWGAPDSQLMRAASRNLFVAMIARAKRPGAQVDTIFVLEGPQGSFKSKSLRELGGEFHAEISAPIGTIDFQRELRGIWLAEIGELDSLRGKEATTVKRLLSAPRDRFVEKYQIHAETYPRRAIIVGSTNEATYWQDATGARRLIPIACGRIRTDVIADMRLQWLAEARDAYLRGDSWWQFPSSITDEQEARQQIDPWEDILRAYMAHGRTSGADGQGVVEWPEGWISSATIMSEWLRLDPHQQGPASGVRLGKVMRHLGYRPERYGKGRERGWAPDTQEREQAEASAEVSAHSSL